MPASIAVAQSSPDPQTIGPGPKQIRLTKPAGGQAVTIDLVGPVNLDLTSVAGEKITLVHVGDKLVILFEDRATITLEHFFGADGQIVPGLDLHVGPGRNVSGPEFAELFPITTDQSVLPTAGDGPPSSSPSFSSSGVDALGDVPGGLELLGGGQVQGSAFGPSGPNGRPIEYHPPVAAADAGAAIEAGVRPLNLQYDGVQRATGNVLANDSDPDPNDRISVVGAAQGHAAGDVTGQVGQVIEGVFGSLIIAADGTWTYTLDNLRSVTQALTAGEHGSDVFTYTIRDLTGLSATTTLTIDVLGTDDRPIIAAGAAAGVAEQADVTGSSDVDQVSGTLAFSDVDLNDVGHTAAVIGVASSGVTVGLAPDALTLQSFLHIDATSKAAGADAGKIDWTFSAPDGTFDYLSAGEQLVLTYTVEVDDHDGGTGTNTITITVTGAEDKPQIAAGVSAGITEQADTTGSSAPDRVSGTLAFTDADLNDIGHLATVSGVTTSGVTGGLAPDALALQSFLYIETTTKFLGADVGTIGWTFSAPDGTFDYLAEGEQLILTYTVEVDDQHGGTAANTVTITVTGANDGPAIIGATAAGTIVEDQSELLINGGFEAAGPVGWTIANAIQLNYAPLVHGGSYAAYVFTPGSVTQAVQTVAGAHYGLSFWENDAGSTGTLTVLFGGVVVGTYQLNGDIGFHHYMLDLVGTGGTEALSFQFTSDGFSAYSLDDVSLQVPLDPVRQSASGTISFVDADRSDSHAATYVAENSGTHGDGTAYLGTFTLDPVTEPNGGTGSVTWHFDVERSALQYLAAGQTYQQFYDVTISDGHGGTVTQTVTVTLTGTNDAPVVDAHDAVLTYSEKQAPTAIDTVLTLSDVDSTTLAGAKVWISGGFHAGEDFLGFTGQNGITGSYDAAAGTLTLSGIASLADYQAALRSVTYFNGSSNPSTDTRTISFQVDDGGPTDHTSNIGSTTVTVGPVNDAPAIVSSAWSVGVTEDASFATPPQLIKNASFENDNGVYPYPPTDWTYGGYSYYPPGSTGTSHSGGAALNVYTYQSTTGATVSQTFATEIGQTYHIRFFAELETLSTGNFLGVSWNGTVLGSVSNLTTYGTYIEYDYDVVATSTSATLQFNLVSGRSGYWFLDDVSVTPTYTPGTETRSGVITYTDPDLADHHTLTVTNGGGDYVGQFAVTQSDSFGSGTGKVNWTFTVDDSEIQHLGANETLTQTYTVTIDDGHGGQTSQDVTVAIHGVNDAPVAVNDSIVINGYGSSAPGTATSTPVLNETTANNNSISQAQTIDRAALKIAPNPNLGDASDPAITVKGSLASGDKDYYQIVLKAGEKITLDVDNTSGNLDTVVKLYDSNGNLVASSDDSSPSDGGGGSSRDYWYLFVIPASYDSYLTYTATQDGAYYVDIERKAGSGTYDLQVSIDNFQAFQGEAVTIPTDFLLANDSDLDGDALSIVGVSGAGVQLSGDSIIIQPGVTSFSYTVSDGTVQQTATVSVSQIAGQTNTGTAADNDLIGSNAADTLSGLGGHDLLFGGAGDDTLIGGTGSDTLRGGTGSDTFKWLSGDLSGGGIDTILDFETGPNGDVIDFSGLLAGVSGNKADHVRFVYSDGATQLASANGTPHAADGDIKIQVNLSGSTWTDVATIHDTGPNLTAGDEVLKLLLDSSQLWVHV